jgi:hypothetical protein
MENRALTLKKEGGKTAEKCFSLTITTNGKTKKEMEWRQEVSLDVPTILKPLFPTQHE